MATRPRHCENVFHLWTFGHETDLSTSRQTCVLVISSKFTFYHGSNAIMTIWQPNMFLFILMNVNALNKDTWSQLMRKDPLYAFGRFILIWSYITCQISILCKLITEVLKYVECFVWLKTRDEKVEYYRRATKRRTFRRARGAETGPPTVAWPGEKAMWLMQATYRQLNEQRKHICSF